MELQEYSCLADTVTVIDDEGDSYGAFRTPDETTRKDVEIIADMVRARYRILQAGLSSAESDEEESALEDGLQYYFVWTVETKYGWTRASLMELEV